MPAPPQPELGASATSGTSAAASTERSPLMPKLEGAIDFSSAMNPLGPPSAVSAVLAARDVASPGDAQANGLLRALATHLNTSVQNIVVGMGTTEMLKLIAKTQLAPGDRVMVIAPTSARYAQACEAVGAEVLRFTARKRDRFTLDLAALRRILQRDEPRVAFLSNPNNPTGLYLKRHAVLVIAESFDGLLVVDETYLPFIDDADDLIDLAQAGRILVLRSLNKAYAMEGLELDYVVGGDTRTGAMRRAQSAWCVSAAGQAVGQAALREERYLRDTRQAVRASRSFLQTELEGLGFEVAPPNANFLLLGVGDAPAVAAKLLERGLAVRDCTPFNLPEHIRVGVRSLEECKLLVAALRELGPPKL